MRYRKPEKSVRVNVELDSDNLEWLRNRYPGISIWWLFNEFLSKFKSRHEPNKQTELEARIQAVSEGKAESLMDGARYD